MKIVHLCLSCFYIDGYAYQENELVRQHVLDGHDVVVIASTETYGADRQPNYLQPGNYIGAEGAKVIRLPYRNWLPHVLMRKLRMHPGVYRLLDKEKPDVILFHGLCGWELATVARYKKNHPAVKFYADSHEDFNNSARSFFSKYLLHAAFYRPILRGSLGAIEKVLCISKETIDFVRDFYGVSSEKIEFYPLGGMIFDDDDYQSRRSRARHLYGIGEQEILLVQSGKMDKTKKVLEAVNSFSNIKDQRLRFVLAGHLHEDIAKDVNALIQADGRIQFVGWKSPDELRDLLCAADVYVQPGTQSATMQMSLCARCAVILDDVPSHHPFMDNNNGWLLGGSLSLDEAFRQVCEEGDGLQAMSERSAGVAARLLDYRVLAARICR